MAQTKWNQFVLSYKKGDSKRSPGHSVWMSDDGDESVAISDSIANMGKDGWELVSAVYLPSSSWVGEEVMCFFKKAL